MTVATSPSPATKAGRLHTALRDDILTGRLAAGDPVDEATTAAQHDISRTPVREALKALTSEGLLVPGPRRQLRVVDISPEHRREVTSLRVALEVTAAPTACERRTDEDLDDLRTLVDRQRRQAKGGDVTAFLEADEAFHRALAATAAMPTLMLLLDQLGAFVRLARLGAPTPQRHLLALTREHDHLVDLLEAGDGAALSSALEEHIRSTALRG
ncbi:GntR family transcriptional regulator [Janibacter limosus]|uniref:GntR family transcriptional regulator n=1 Tax=Janibacter limosus TaxID=53458 RepID=UPI001F5EBC54|nr:GntR family transcriptional regulator [Janibacter limosus]